MKIYEVWTNDTEMHASNKGTCDSLESALEFAKTLHEWWHRETLYDTIMNEFDSIQNLKKNLDKCYNIRVRDLITIGTLANNA